MVEVFGMASRVGHRARVFACAALIRIPGASKCLIYELATHCHSRDVKSLKGQNGFRRRLPPFDRRMGLVGELLRFVSLVGFIFVAS